MATANTVYLNYRAPYDWPAMLAYLQARIIVGVEHVENEIYTRTFTNGADAGCVEIAHCRESCSFAVTVQNLAATSFPVINRVEKMFDLTADVATISEILAADPLLKRLVAERPGLRVPGCWDPFELAVRAVLGQQVSLQAGRQLTQTLVRLCGVQLPPTNSANSALRWLFPDAARVATADLAALGMPGARKRTLVEVAKAALDDPLLFERGANIEQTVHRLTAIPGIGDWTAHYIAMRAAGEPDAFPAGDAALLRSMGQHTGTRPGKNEFVQRAQAWRPWRAYAAQHLWTSAAAGKPRAELEQ